MKKLLNLMLIVILSISIVGCNKSEKKVEETKEVKETQETKERFSMSEKGDCNFYITTSETLTSENGAIPYIYLEDENTLMQIGYAATEFDSSKITYMYIDGKLTSKETFSNDCEGTITLDDSCLTCTKHKIEIVQYKSSESENKEDVEVYKVAQYVVTNNDEEFSKGNEECKKQMKLKSNQKEDKESEDKSDETEESKDQQSDNSNKTSRKSSSSKSNTSSKKSHTKNESNKKDDDGYYVTCPDCGRKIYTINGDWDCGCYDNSNVDEDNSNNYDEGDNSNNNGADKES